MPNSLPRTVFFVSDGTGITVETLGHSLLSHFPNIQIQQERVPFVDSLDKALACQGKIREARTRSGVRPIVFTSVVDTQVLEVLRQADAMFLDMLEKFISPLEQELGEASTHTVGRFHGVTDSQDYKKRIEAINFALIHDDGVTDAELAKADVILVGVSRSGKTPTSLYLAMQFGVKVANYPLIPEDFERGELPPALNQHRDKLFGLSIDPERLRQIRQERRPDSRYASLSNCRQEVEAGQRMMRREGIRWLDSTTKSIEEISATIMQEVRLNQHGY